MEGCNVLPRGHKIRKGRDLCKTEKHASFPKRDVRGLSQPKK